MAKRTKRAAASRTKQTACKAGPKRTDTKAKKEARRKYIKPGVRDIDLEFLSLEL